MTTHSQELSGNQALVYSAVAAGNRTTANMKRATGLRDDLIRNALGALVVHGWLARTGPALLPHHTALMPLWQHEYLVVKER